MELVVRPDAESAAAAAADFVADRLRAAVETAGVATLAVSGGSTPPRMFEELAKSEVPWHAVHLFQVDERLAPDGHPDRNVTGLREHLLAHVDLPVANFHPMPVGLPNLLDAAERYARTLRAVCGVPPVLDVVHLGLGEDGHVASLVPGDAALDSDDAVAPTGEYGGWIRLTLTVPVLRAARHLCWLVTGAAKRAALAGLLAGEDMPAARMARDDAVVFADEEAAPAG